MVWIICYQQKRDRLMLPWLPSNGSTMRNTWCTPDQDGAANRKGETTFMHNAAVSQDFAAPCWHKQSCCAAISTKPKLKYCMQFS
jgi:hypothetical protein